MPPRRPASLKVRALQWLAQREHSRAELRERLLRLARSSTPDADHARNPRSTPATIAAVAPDRHAIEAEVDTLLDWLCAHRYLSDARFVESRVHARQARFGNLRIERELGRHDLAPDANQARELCATEYERALAVWRRKFAGATPDGDARARVRQMRFLAGRGFSPEVIRRVLRTAGLPDDADPAPDSSI